MFVSAISMGASDGIMIFFLNWFLVVWGFVKAFNDMLTMYCYLDLECNLYQISVCNMLPTKLNPITWLECMTRVVEVASE